MQLTLTVRSKNVHYLAVLSCLVFSYVALVGCRVTGHKNSHDMVQRNMRYMGEKPTCFLLELAESSTTSQDVSSVLSSLGATDEEIRQIFADPFHSLRFHRVQYSFTCSPAMVVSFCTERLQQAGWMLMREALLSEYSNAGGDWVRVYRKSAAFVRIHVYGYRGEIDGRNVLDLNEQINCIIERNITFDLLNYDTSLFHSEIGIHHEK